MQTNLFNYPEVLPPLKPLKKSLQNQESRLTSIFPQKESYLAYNMVSVHIDRLNITRHVEIHRKSKHQIIKSEEENTLQVPEEKKTIKFSDDGVMSGATQRKISKAVKYLNFVTLPQKLNNPVTGKDFNFKICFATCTLSSPQCHSDNEIKSKIINQFIIELKQKYKVANYIWRIEKQKNKNAHFHFLLDKFIPHTELRNIWNRIQNKLGYVDQYQQRMQLIKYKEYVQLFKNSRKSTPQSILASWKKGKATNWCYPNSTDIHSLLFIENIDAYIIKYLNKEDQNKGIAGRLWSCSHSLSNLTGAREIIDNSIHEEIESLINSGLCRHVKGEYYEIVFTDWFKLEKSKCYILMSMLREWLINQFNLKRPQWMQN